MPEGSGHEPGWLDPKTYEVIQRAVPIVCVDALPYTTIDDVLHVGLIWRQVPRLEGGWTEGWTLVGGRVRRGESLAEAFVRHLRETLGEDISIDLGLVDFHRPSAVGEYMTEPREGFSFDSRQHAVALTYPVRVDGVITPMGEAVAFRWFRTKDLPPRREIGFRQDIVIDLALRALVGDDSSD